ncbi:carbamoylphosphate synthase large subunit [Weissella oryzae SG25]|uniref:Carbamoylphosphate synthase large subunit n=1 Tax=Weissella oryzae (strain DSM 25784 / JCM 18191 / LMG 30913 / SG25) TaxID=1329250 RepID=A0A069CUT2_WEIOS|nr:hypothetical protein [Weissella oryzae]GAK31157.1 carbamoylphosphate synthase large subunit [Weissella oryzae SG25]
MIIFGIFYLIKYVANKFLLIEKLDNKELLKAEVHSDNWGIIESYAVIGTPYYTILKTQDNYYFLVKHDSFKNLFLKKSTWQAYKLSEADAKQAIDNNAVDRTLISLGGFSAILIFLSNTFMQSPDWLWFLNIKNVLLILLAIMMGSVLGILRIQLNLKKYQENSVLLTKLGKTIQIQIMSNQRWTIVVPLIAYVVLIIMPLPVFIKAVSWALLFIEIVPRMFSSITSLKRRRDPSQITKVQRYLYGEEAAWLNLGEPSEINNNYKEHI